MAQGPRIYRYTPRSFPGYQDQPVMKLMDKRFWSLCFNSNTVTQLEKVDKSCSKEQKLF